jgi:CubicO group peptidase (beta-lactamase class C family)
MVNTNRRLFLQQAGLAVGTGAVLPLLGAEAATASQVAGGVLAESGIGHADPGTSHGIPKGLRPGGAYDRLVAQLAAQDRFSGTVLLARRGRPVLLRCYGMADKDQAIPIRPDTIFNIASLGKFFTGVAITQLMAQQKLRLDGTLGSYLDGFPDQVASMVTVHQLLTHTSGLGDHRADPAWQEASTRWNTRAEFNNGTLAFIRRQQLLFTPGTQLAYSNSGYWVLGAIVASVSGQSYWDYVREHVFAPAGMTRTSFATVPQWQTHADFAHAYGDPDPDGRRPDLTKQMKGIGIGGGDGGTFSTAPDLLRFALALQNGKLFDRAHFELMTSGKFPFGTGMVAYGTLAAIINGKRLIGHGGNDPGITSNLLSFVDLEWVWLLVSNYDVIPDLGALTELPVKLISQQLN